MHTHTQQCGDSQAESRGWGRWRWANVEEMGTERDFAFGNEHTMQCTDDVLLIRILETCMFFSTSVTPINSIKNIDYIFFLLQALCLLLIN